MPPKFDPYYQWLGIDPADQPPNHYRLLGLRPFEADPDVIEMAADRRMLHVQTFRHEPQSAALSQALLKELAAARECLLTPASKADYDANLRAAIASRTATNKAAVAATARTSAVDQPLPANVLFKAERSISGVPRPLPSQAKSAGAMLAVGVAAAGLFALGAWLTWSSRPTAPRLPAIARQTLVEGQTLSLQLAPTNVAQLRGRLVFEILAGSPVGAHVDRDSGALVWIPAESQGPGLHTISVRGSVAGSPHLRDELSIEVQVLEDHQAPQLDPIVLRSEGRGALSAVVHGRDLDLPPGGLKYSFEITPVPTAAPLLSEGQFFWRPATEDLRNSFEITFRVAKAEAPEYVTRQVVRTGSVLSELAAPKD